MRMIINFGFIFYAKLWYSKINNASSRIETGFNFLNAGNTSQDRRLNIECQTDSSYTLF